VGDDLGCSDALVGEAVERELVKHSLGSVRLDQALDREERGGQRRDPQYAFADARQQPGIGADRERDQRGDEQEKGDRKPGRAADSPARVASDERGDHAPSSSVRQAPGSG
jgi:hypothetical protein